MMAENPGRQIARPPASHVDVASSPVLGKFALTYPLLQAFLEEKRVSQNHHKTGCMTLFWDHGSYKLCLNDRPQERSTFVTGRSLGQLFAAADSGLECGQLEWRKKGYKLR